MTTTNPMACGNCGNGLFRISRNETEIHAECLSCASVSVITTKPAELHIEWGVNAKGILCDMKPSMEQVTPPEPPAIEVITMCPGDTCTFVPAPNGRPGTVCSKCGFDIPF